MIQSIETLIIGGGQAGLATSYHLKQRGSEHLILEAAAQPAHAWRDDRWDSFVLNTPNWTVKMPGAEYAGKSPDGFMARNEVVSYLEQYVEKFDLPVRYGLRVTSVEPDPHSDAYRVSTGEEVYQTRNVVVATGLYQQPKIPSFSAQISPVILQCAAGQYRNPQSLPPGAVLVVGSGQTGCQVAEELYQSGRNVYICVGSAGRVPRRYRGRDIFEWLELSGFLMRTSGDLPSLDARFFANPQLSGRDGGHNINLHQFVRDGVMLLGRLVGAQEDVIHLASDLKENLAKTDRFESDQLKMVDAYIRRAGLDAPLETVPQLCDGYDLAQPATVSLKSAGIRSIIWAIGYTFDFSLVKLPVFDRFGYPLQRRGVTGHPGLYFVGLPWLHTFKSGLLLGVGEDAGYIAAAIAGRE
jgi:putative flavoprotein involved in K+ transport